MAYNITIGNKTIEITESGNNILKAILEIEFSPPTVVSFCSLGGYRHYIGFNSFNNQVGGVTETDLMQHLIDTLASNKRSN